MTFRRPEKLNALTPDDITVARRAVEEIPPGVRALVFIGAGERAFSAGVHVEVFRDMDTADARAFISDLGRLFTAVRNAPVPTIAAVHGFCLGGAMELAMACDLRIGSTEAVFGMPEIKVGIPSVLDAALLQQYIGLSRAREILLTGDLYSAADLQPHGFLNRLVAPPELEQAVTAMARAVGAHAPAAVAAQKRLFGTWQNVGLQPSIEASIGEFAEVFADPDARDRIAGYRSDG